MATVNRLVREATGDICVLTDVSELFDPDAVRALVQHFLDPSVGAVTGKHVFFECDSTVGIGTRVYWRLQRFLQQGETRLYGVCHCDGTIYACRRELFPYPPEDTINDDAAVPLAIISRDKRVVFEPAAIARGDVLENSNRFFWQRVRGQAGRYQLFFRHPRMLVPWPFRRWLVYVSHFVCPSIVPWCMVVALVTNFVLAVTSGPIYRVLLACQGIFYLLAVAGLIAEVSQRRWRIAAVPFYFMTANTASLLGFAKWLLGRQRPTWRKVQ